jgi:hypothetical protein
MRGKCPTYRRQNKNFPVYDRSLRVGDPKMFEAGRQVRDLPRIGGRRPIAAILIAGQLRVIKGLRGQAALPNLQIS